MHMARLVGVRVRLKHECGCGRGRGLRRGRGRGRKAGPELEWTSDARPYVVRAVAAGVSEGGIVGTLVLRLPLSSIEHDIAQVGRLSVQKRAITLSVSVSLSLSLSLSLRFCSDAWGRSVARCTAPA